MNASKKIKDIFKDKKNINVNNFHSNISTIVLIIVKYFPGVYFILFQAFGVVF